MGSHKDLSKRNLNLGQDNSHMIRNGSVNIAPSFLMSNSQSGKFPEQSYSDEPIEEYDILKNNSPNRLDTVSSQSNFIPG